MASRSNNNNDNPFAEFFRSLDSAFAGGPGQQTGAGVDHTNATAPPGDRAAPSHFSAYGPGNGFPPFPMGQYGPFGFFGPFGPPSGGGRGGWRGAWAGPPWARRGGAVPPWAAHWHGRHSGPRVGEEEENLYDDSTDHGDGDTSAGRRNAAPAEEEYNSEKHADAGKTKEKTPGGGENESDGNASDPPEVAPEPCHGPRGRCGGRRFRGCPWARRPGCHRGGRRGHHGTNGPYGHHGPFGPHGAHGHGPCGPHVDRGFAPPPFSPFCCPGGGGGSRGPFDFRAMMATLAQHPWAQHIRDHMDQVPQHANRSGNYDTTTDQAAGGDNNYDAPPTYSHHKNSQDVDNDTVTPPIDIFNSPGNWTVHIALPGAKRENVSVNWDAHKSVLDVCGVIHRPGDEEFIAGMVSGERRVGLFERKIKLPPAGVDEKDEAVEGEFITAKMEEGILIIVVPKAERDWTEVRKVDIE